MRDSRLKHLRALERMRCLAEQRAELRVQETAGALRVAAQKQEQAHARSDAVMDWKSALPAGSALPVGLYEQVLVTEHALLVAAHATDLAHADAASSHRIGTEHLLQANRGVKVVQRRRMRADHALAHAHEVSAADAAADLWLARRVHADR